MPVTMDTNSVDEEGNILVLERVSVKPYSSKDEYIFAMKEDLAEWFNKLYDNLSLTEKNFFQNIETGVVLCQHANTVQNYIHEFSSGNGSFHPQDSEVIFRRSAKAGSFQSRDNISNFLQWCRTLSIPDVLLFETEDLVSRKNERNVVLTLLEVARRGAKYGVPAPTIIEMEQEIDREIEEEKNPQKPPTPPVQRRTVDMMSLDEMVRELLGICTCPDQFPMIRVSEGKYKIGDNETLIFVRILRNHVMVRIGGGWDTLENYLNRHDPCRCGSKGHKSNRGFSASKNSRRVSAPSPVQRPKTPSKPRASLQENNRIFHPTGSLRDQIEDTSPTPNGVGKKTQECQPTTPLLKAPMERRKAPGAAVPLGDHTPSATRRPSSPRLASPAMGRPASPARGRPASPALGRPASPAVGRPASPAFGRSASPAMGRPASPAFGRSASPAPMRASPVLRQKSSEGRESPKPRPSTPRERRASSSSSTTEEIMPQSRTKERSAPGRAQRTSPAPRHRPPEEMLVISRDSSGKHHIEQRNGVKGNRKEKTREAIKKSEEAKMEEAKNEEAPAKRFSTSRLNMTADKLLPSMPKLRSQSSVSSDITQDSDADSSPPVMLHNTSRSALTRSTASSSRAKAPEHKSESTPQSRSSLARPSSARVSSASRENERGRTPQRTRPSSARASSSSARISSSNGRTPSATGRSSSSSRQLPETPRPRLTPAKTIDVPERPRSNLSHMRRNSMSSATFSLNVDYTAYPEAPPENEDLNAKMELLFEEYKKVEMGLSTGKSTEPEKPAPERSRSSSRPASDARRPRKSGLASMANPPSANARGPQARSSSVGRIPVSYNRSQSIERERISQRSSQVDRSREREKTVQRSSQAERSRERERTVQRSNQGDRSRLRTRKLPEPATRASPVQRQKSASAAELEEGVIHLVHEDLVQSRIDESSVIHMVHQSDDEEEKQKPYQVMTADKVRQRLAECASLKAPPKEGQGVEPESKFLSNGHQTSSNSSSCVNIQSISQPSLVNGYESSNSSVAGDSEVPNLAPAQRSGFRSRLPRPTKTRPKTRTASPPLKRCDSGVEINNMSPSDNSNHGDDEAPWQPLEAVVLKHRPCAVINDPLDLENDDEYY